MKHVSKVLGIVVIVVLVLIVKREVIDKNKAVDITELRNATPAQVETTLNVQLFDSSQMAENVYEYSKAKAVTVKGNTDAGIGVVYLDGSQSGFRVENPEYIMFNIAIGKSRVGMESAMTYSYEEEFEIEEEMEKELFGNRKDFPVFYCNWTNNDCVVVSCEKSTGKVVAVTYFKNAKKVTERLIK
nr:hypothetical protein [Lachnospiraceae bacterium]